MTKIKFDSQRVYEHIRYLTEQIGPRMRGSDANQKALEYIRSSMENLDLEITEQEFDVQTASLNSFGLEILDPPIGKIPCQPVLMSPDTPADGLTGEVIFVEGVDEPNVGTHIRDKIVLWYNSTKSPQAVQSIAKYQPKAILMIWHAPGCKTRHMSMNRLFGPYPPVTTFMLAWEEGIRLVKAGVKRARLFLNSTCYQSKGRNLVAQLKGQEQAKEIVVIGGHYDSPFNIPGAFDNASGVAIMMELARIFSEEGSRRTLRFIAWDAEEAGYHGSIHYLKNVICLDKQERSSPGFVSERDKTELDRHHLCVNLDCLGSILGHNVCYVLGPSEIKTSLSLLSKELGVAHQIIEGFYGSDHEPFAWAGIPALAFGREGPAFGYIHTDDDNIDLIDAGQIQRVGELIVTFLERTASRAYVWPFGREIPAKLMKKIDEHAEQRGNPLAQQDKQGD
ncbi:MAG: M28 family peptidase [Anaerolineales bacterium]|nr:M28 family peptidase [Anaerolineales bacterium]